MSEMSFHDELCLLNTSSHSSYWPGSNYHHGYLSHFQHCQINGYELIRCGAFTIKQTAVFKHSHKSFYSVIQYSPLVEGIVNTNFHVQAYRNKNSVTFVLCKVALKATEIHYSCKANLQRESWRDAWAPANIAELHWKKNAILPRDKISLPTQLLKPTVKYKTKCKACSLLNA